MPDKNVSSEKNKTKLNIEDKINKKELFDFQINDWNSYHEIDEDNEETYVIQLFGRTEDDKDVCLKVTDFTPFFYVEVPLNWKQHQAWSEESGPQGHIRGEPESQARCRHGPNQPTGPQKPWSAPNRIS